MLALQLKTEDTVATVLQETRSGDNLEIVIKGKSSDSVSAKNDIPYGFKIAIKPMTKGTPVVKYGCVIGLASTNISTGELVHIHNIEGCRGRGDKKGE